MTQEEQQDVFYQDLHNLINRYIDEFNITTSSAIGCLHMVILDIYKIETEARERNKDKE